MRSINFLEWDRKYRLARMLGDVRAALAVVGIGLGIGLGIVVAVTVGGSLHIRDQEARLGVLQAQREQLEEQRLSLSARLGGDIARIAPLLPRINTIRLSGELVANRIAQIGVEKKSNGGVWLDSMSMQPQKIAMEGGSLTLADLGGFLGELKHAQYAPTVISNTPKQGRKPYFDYAVQMPAQVTP
jgi:hypothetical protein